MIILFFVFSIVSVLVAFYSYRVFKAMAMGQLGSAAPSGGGVTSYMRGMQVPSGRNNRDDEVDEERNNYIPPSQANQNNQYQVNATQSASTQARPAPKGGFVPFGGAGVRIGGGQ